MPCHEYDAKSTAWFNERFISAVEPIMTNKDIMLIQRQRKVFFNLVSLADRDHKGVLDRVLNAKRLAFDIYAKYAQLWHQGLDLMDPQRWPEALKTLRKERGDSEGVDEPFFSNDWSRLFDGTDFTPLHSEDQTIHNNWTRFEDGSEDSDGEDDYSPEAGKEFHEQKKPANRAEAKKHMESWVRVMGYVLNEDKVKEWQEWCCAQADLAIYELDIYFKNHPRREEWQTSLSKLTYDLMTEVMGICEKFRWCFRYSKQAHEPFPCAYAGAIRKLILNTIRKYEARLVELRKALWAGGEDTGLGGIIRIACENGQAQHWINFCGGMLPGMASDGAYLPRIVWPAAFELHYASRQMEKALAAMLPRFVSDDAGLPRIIWPAAFERHLASLESENGGEE